MGNIYVVITIIVLSVMAHMGLSMYNAHCERLREEAEEKYGDGL